MRFAPSLLALLAAALLAACDGGAPSFRSIDISGAAYARDFALTDHTGKTRALADFRGKVVVIFFGYTHCPDVCPTTLADLSQVMRKLGTDADRVQVLFVTLDPERDTQAALARYVPAFDARFLGMYADPQATLKTAQDFRIFYEKRPGSTPGSYTVDHSAASFVYDPHGRVRLYVRQQQIATLVEDIRVLLKQQG